MAIVVFEGYVRFLNTDGEDVGGFYFDNLVLAANSSGWLADPDMLTSNKIFPIDGGKYDDVELALSSVALGDPDETKQDYSSESELLSHSISTDQYPRHNIKIQVSNVGTETMHHTKVFAAIYNSNGELVDISWSEMPGDWPTGKKIEPGEGQVFSVTSLAKTGRCLGEADPKGYQIDYWIDAMTYTGLPINKFFSIDVP